MQLEERSPFQLLERGYAIAYDASGKVLRSPDQVALGDEISVRLARGRLDATVRRKKEVDLAIISLRQVKKMDSQLPTAIVLRFIDRINAAR